MVWSVAKLTSAVLMLLLAIAAEGDGKGDKYIDVIKERDVIKKRAVTSAASLEAVVAALSQKVEALQTNSMAITNELQNKIYHESVKRNQLEEQVNKLINNGGSSSTPSISFFTKYQPDLFASNTLNAMDKLVVSSVVNNEGKAYDGHTGIFTAPFNGSYVFFLNAFSSFNHSAVMQVDVMTDQDSLPLCSARAPSQQSGGSCQAVTRLVIGQMVWLRNLWNDAKYWPGLTTFSGFLLHLD